MSRSRKTSLTSPLFFDKVDNGYNSYNCYMLKMASNFPDLDSHPDFVKMEEERLKHWYRDGIVEKYLHKNDKSKKKFSFLDGPITANNPMGVHHGRGRTYKDLWQRYHTMKGERQRYQNGFDCQGLWVEVEVEKELGFKSKKDILGYGVEKFVEKCKERVRKFAAVQTEQSRRLGMFMDWSNSYYTMSDENNYAIWNFLKVCHRRGWIYKGNDSVPWCPRCETAISQHEMLTEDYKEVTHKAIYLELPIERRDREYLLVWTTTPWTIPANIAVAVDKNLEYSLVKGKTGDLYWIAKDAVERVFKGEYQKIIETVKGKKLVGLRYRGPFDDLPAAVVVAKNSKFHMVIATDPLIMPISTSEGTGFVHTAVSAGSEDFKLGKKYGLPMIPVIEDNADYMPGLGEFSGKNAKKHPELIFDYLLKREKENGENWVFEIHDYKHRYPACWRCKTELVWKVTDEWYIAMDKQSQVQSSKFKVQSSQTLRQQLMEAAKKVRWIPGFGLERELDWLKNMHDWLISKKNRFWGLALPIWECDKCGKFTVIGGKSELREKSVKGWDKFSGHSPHKPWIDEVKIKCEKCGGEMSRIEPVGNPWLDAGIVPFSTMPANWFPADFITESFPGQFKNWFYSMLVMSTVLAGGPPFKTVLGFESVTGEDGRPMHKSWGNMVEFNEGAKKIGVDVMRWMYAKAGPTTVLPFGYKAGDEIRRRFMLILWNSFRFFVTQAKADNWINPSSRAIPTNILDKWILVRLKETILAVTKSLDDYQSAAATEALETLVEDFSTWYIRRSRDRVGPAASDMADKNAAYQTMYLILVDLSKLLAPFMPYISDYMYRILTGEESVHLASWPGDSRSARNPRSLPRRLQVSKKVKVLSGSSSMVSEIPSSARPKLETGVSKVLIIEEMKLVREIASLGHGQRKTAGIPVRQPLSCIKVISLLDRIGPEFEKLLLDEVNVKKMEWKGEGGDFQVELNTEITDELKREGEARRLIRLIQKMRRDAGVGLADKVEAGLTDWPEEYEEMIKRETLTEKLVRSKEIFVKL